MIGATRIPATPASAAPMVHVAEDTKPGEIPSAAAPRSFWETAAVTQPIRVNRHTIVKIAVSPTAMQSSQTYPDGRVIEEPKCQTLDGNSCWTNGGSAPQTLTATASSTNSTATVATRRDSGDALRMRRSSS